MGGNEMWSKYLLDRQRVVILYLVMVNIRHM